MESHERTKVWRSGACIALVVVAVLTAAPWAIQVDAASFVYPVQAEQAITGTTSGLAGAQADDGAQEVLAEVDTAADPTSAPSSETVTLGTTLGGTFPGDVAAEDGAAVSYQEAIPARSNHYPGSQTIPAGASCGGTFPGDLQSSDNAYVCLRETANVGFDASSGYTQDTASTSFSWSHTTSGTNRLLVVGVAIRTSLGQTVNSVTYNAVALTVLRTDELGGSVRSELWYLVNPTTGTNTVNVTLSASGKAAMGAISLTGVNQTAPLDANNGATGNSNAPSTTVTTVADNAWVVDVVAFRSTGSGSPTGGPGAGQTQRWSRYSENTGSNIRSKGSTEGPRSPPGAVVMDWSLSSSVDWAVSAASFRGVGIAGDARLDVRHDWSGIPVGGDAYDLCVEAHVASGAGEAMLARVLTPPVTWNTRITIVKTADDDADQCSTLTPGEFNGGSPSVRWSGANEVGDLVVSDVVIDRERIIRSFTNYALSVRYDWAGVPAGNAHRLDLTASRTDENVNVQVRTPPATWNTRLTVSSGTPQRYAYTLLLAEYNGGSPAIRFLDTVAADPIPSDLTIDLASITTIDLQYQLEIRQDITGIGPGSNPVLIVKGNGTAGGEDFHVEAWNNTAGAWDRLLSAPFTDVNAYHNASLNTNHLSAGSVQVRFVDAGTQDSVAGALGLDFVAVAITNAPASLSAEGISPAVGNLTTSFGFFVRYTDAENDPPTNVILTLSGIDYAMMENNSADLDHADGKDYFMDLIIGVRGIHDYWYSTGAVSGDVAVTSTALAQVSVLNRVPSITNGVSADSVHTGQPYVIDFNGSDLDGDILTWSLITDAPWLAIVAANGTVWGLAPSTPGGFVAEVSAADGYGGFDWNNYTLSVGNVGPAITNAVPTVTALRRASVAFDLDGADPDGDSLVWTLRSDATFLQIGAANGTVFGVTSSSPGTYWFEVTATDGFGGLDVANMTLLVVNRGPQVSVTFPVAIRANDPYGASFSGFDPDDDGLTWTLETNATWLRLDATGLRLWGTGSAGVYFANLTARDPYGGSANRNVTIVVYTVPLPPPPPPSEFPAGLFLFAVGVASSVLWFTVGAPRRQVLRQAFLFGPDGRVVFQYSTPRAPYDEPKLRALLAGQDWRTSASIRAPPHTLHVVQRASGEWVLIARTTDRDRVMKAAEQLMRREPQEPLPEGSPPLPPPPTDE